MLPFQYYIELSGYYERQCPPATCAAPNEEEFPACAGDNHVESVQHVGRQQSMESGVFMSPDVETTASRHGGRHQRPLVPPSRPSSDASSSSSSAAVWMNLSPVRCRSDSTDAGYLLPTVGGMTSTNGCRRLSAASERCSVSAMSDSDMCGSVESDIVFELSTLL